MRIAVAAMIALPGCAGPPQMAEPTQFDPPRWEHQPNLAVKAERHEQLTLEQVDEAGWLLYQVVMPWDTSPIEADRRYLTSHNSVDIPAWQGYLMAAIGFKMAALVRDEPQGRGAAGSSELARLNAELRRLAGAYDYAYRVTGVRGYFPRTLVPGYIDEKPLEWMAENLEDSPGGDWKRSETTGEWFRDAINKDHFNLAIFGFSVPLTLDRSGAIELENETERALIRAMLPAVRRLVDDEYVLRTSEGEKTPFPDLGPTTALLPNGFQRTIALHVLATAAPYDESLETEYRKRVDDWTSGLAWSMETSGDWSSWRGRWNRKVNVSTSDVQGFALAACSFLMQTDDEEAADAVRDSLGAWWEFMRYELNAPFTLVQLHFVEADVDVIERHSALITRELRDFPPIKSVAVPADLLAKLERTPGIVQPIANRPVDSNYWKSNAYERVTAAEERRPNSRFAAMDYLLAYWMGRWFELIPAE